MKIPDPECIPLGLVSRGLHLPSIILSTYSPRSVLSTLIIVMSFGLLSSISKRVKFGLGPRLGVGCAQKYND